MKYDVVIVGAGPSGYFCAYELVKKSQKTVSEGRIQGDRKKEYDHRRTR